VLVFNKHHLGHDSPTHNLAMGLFGMESRTTHSFLFILILHTRVLLLGHMYLIPNFHWIFFF
jgi:hypothetical protein